MNTKLHFLLLLTLVISCKPKADEYNEEIKILINNDRCSDVITLATKYIESYPNDVRFYYSRGYCFLRTSVQKAKEDFSTCIRIDPTYHNGYYGLASAYEEEHQFDLAEMNYKKAIENATDNERKATYLGGLASLYQTKREYKKAIEIQKKSIELNDKADAYTTLGEYYLISGDKKEGEATLLKAINEKQFRQIEFKHSAYASLASYYFKEREYKKAKVNIEKAIELAPSNNDYVKLYNQVKLYAK
jgi:tetratricopeptide (TPR) repeat protein